MATVRRRQKKPHGLRLPQKKRVGTTDSLLEAAGLDSSDSGQPSAPQTPTSYLSMPSVNSFPRCVKTRDEKVLFVYNVIGQSIFQCVLFCPVTQEASRHECLGDELRACYRKTLTTPNFY